MYDGSHNDFRMAGSGALKIEQTIVDIGKSHLVVWLFAFILAWSNPVSAVGHISESAWLEDPSGKLTFSQVQALPQAFTKSHGVLTRGYTPSAYWVRLRINPTLEDRLIVRIRPSYIDHIELHDPLDHAYAGGNITPRSSGDRYPKQQSGYESLNHGFSIPGGPIPRDLYLRLRSSSTMLVYPEVLTVAEANVADRRQELIYSVYLGLLAAFLIWAFLQWLVSKELLIAVFLIKQLFVMAHAVALQGYLPILFGTWLSGPAMDQITSFLVLAYVFSGSLFMLMLLREFKPVRWLWWLFSALLWLYLPLVVLLCLGKTGVALHINMIIATIYSFGFLLLAISARAWRKPDTQPPLPRWVLISFTAALLFTANAAALPSLGGIEGAEWSLNAPMFAGFLLSLLMIVLLNVRARNIEKCRLQSFFDLQQARQVAEQEKYQREEQGRFLAMLTHELKTPLGVVRMSLGKAQLTGPQRERIERALSNINAIIDRCRITDEIEHHRLLPQAEACDLSALVDECIAACNAPERVNVSEKNSVHVTTDSQLVAICVANLIDNALKYSPPNSAVTVRICLQSAASPACVHGVELIVSNLIGQAGAPDPGQLFVKYYRSPRALSKSGSGLGLYLTRSIAVLLGGQLTCRAETDHVEFCLWIPT